MKLKNVVTLSSGALLLFTGVIGPATSALAADPQVKIQKIQKNDSVYEYVSHVFEKLQAHWEPGAYEQTLSNALLTFVLNPNGTIASSQLQTVAGDNDSGQKALQYVKQNAPYGKFPASLQGEQLVFRFKIMPTSLQMVSYQAVPQQSKTKDVVVKSNLPIDGTMMGASLFYMGAQAPSLNGKVSWNNPDTQNEAELSMQGYVDEVEKQIQQKWTLPEGAISSERAVALLMIDRDGSLLSATLKQSSGNKVVDQAALNAVTQSAPFARVPQSALSLPVTIEYVFERVAPEPSEPQ